MSVLTTREQEPLQEEEVTEVDILEVKLIKKILDAVDRDTLPSLEVLNGCTQGKRIFLTEDLTELTIGRESDCDFAIPEDVISRQHVKIGRRWGGICLIDLDSKNGSFVNNKRVHEEFLHDGDRIALGTIMLLFRNPQEIDLKAIEAEAIRKRPKAVVKPLSQPTPAAAKEVTDVLKEIPALETASANVYPTVAVKEHRMTPLEIGLIGLGVIVLSFATITLVNLVLS